MASNKARVAIVGVGNCASSLVPGLMHVNVGGYHIRDIQFSAAFDINARKVGSDLSEAIYAEPNNTYVFAQVPPLNVPVMRGPTMDGVGKYCHDLVPESSRRPVDVAKVLRDTGTDVLVCYLPVGSEKAARWYAQQALEARCAMVNCIPVFIASREQWRKKFEEREVPIIGDDIKSQVGATITHRVLTHLFQQRGVRLDRTYQLNSGGNTDFLNMLERERLESKKISKRNAVVSQLEYPISIDNAHIGPSDYAPWMKDRKFCYIRMEGTTFGNVPLLAELRLEVWDSPNSAGVVIDAVRCAKMALDSGIAGALWGPSAYFMKSPPRQYTDEQAFALMDAFIRSKADLSPAPRNSARLRDELSRSGNGKSRPERPARSAPGTTARRAVMGTTELD